MPSRLVLFAEDNDIVAKSISDSIRHVGMEPLHCHSGEEAKRHWERRQPDIVILDYRMPEPDGLSMLRWWTEQKHLPETKVIMYSNAEDFAPRCHALGVEFWPKATYQEFEKQLLAAAAKLPPYRFFPLRQVVSVEVSLNAPIRARRQSGSYIQEDVSDHSLQVDPEKLTTQFQAFLESKRWRALCIDHGIQLFDALLPRGIHSLYYRCLEALQNRRDLLSVQLEIPIELAAAGVEALHDRSEMKNGSFLALMHPMTCRIPGINTNAHPISRATLNARGMTPIRVLLVSANNSDGNLSQLDYADDEINRLESLLKESFGKRGIKLEVECLPSKFATIATVSDRLMNKFDIVHFAGHGIHDKDDPYKSGIYLTSGGGPSARRGNLLDCRTFADLLAQSPPALVFLNSCHGASQAAPESLKQFRVLGTAHGMMKAGAAAVLAHRTEVSDSIACDFALSFYENLAETGELDIALLAARQKFENDRAWLSAALFCQK